jgi:hypothetical protein
MYKDKIIEAARAISDRCGLIVKPDGNTHVVVSTPDMDDLRAAIEAYDAWRAELKSTPITGGG